MSEFIKEEVELSCIDCEIIRYAELCGVDLENPQAVEACLNQTHETWVEDKSRETLLGLLLLRSKLEGDMVSQGKSPPPLTKHHRDHWGHETP